jgi:MoaA/NifB/PqqE/SkfB family radical SAM enzyme
MQGLGLSARFGCVTVDGAPNGLEVCLNAATATGVKRCGWVYDSLHIDDRGNVSACCHSKPGPVGNIHEKSLREIYNSEAMQEFRRREMEGTLSCAQNCSVAYSEPAEPSLVRDFDTDLEHLYIKFGERCNISCVMCSQDHASRYELDPDLLVKNVEIPPSVDLIMVYGGEPLILKSMRRFFDHCTASGTKLNIQTNGTAISTTMADKIALNCRTICFSLNAATKEMHEAVNVGSNFERVLENVQRVKRAKRELNSDVSIGGHMTIIEKNLHEIPLFIRRHIEFGFEWAHFGYEVSVPRILAKDPEGKRMLVEEIRQAIAEAPPAARIDTRRLKLLGLVEEIGLALADVPTAAVVDTV